MKTMVFTMLAAAFMMLAATVAYSGMSSDSFTAIDSNNHAVVSISEASSPVILSSGDRVSLDSNGLWLVSDYTKVHAGESAMASSGSQMKSSGTLYCFDSLSRFCAVAY